MADRVAGAACGPRRSDSRGGSVSAARGSLLPRRRLGAAGARAAALGAAGGGDRRCCGGAGILCPAPGRAWGEPRAVRAAIPSAAALDSAFAEEEAGQLVDAITFNTVTDEHVVDAITFDTVTDEHVRWYQESMPDSPTTRDVIVAATSDLPVLRWLGRRRIAATINARAKAVK